jgi:hypothetical protein
VWVFLTARYAALFFNNFPFPTVYLPTSLLGTLLYLILYKLAVGRPIFTIVNLHYLVSIIDNMPTDLILDLVVGPVTIITAAHVYVHGLILIPKPKGLVLARLAQAAERIFLTAKDIVKLGGWSFAAIGLRDTNITTDIFPPVKSKHVSEACLH